MTRQVEPASTDRGPRRGLILTSVRDIWSYTASRVLQELFARRAPRAPHRRRQVWGVSAECPLPPGITAEWVGQRPVLRDMMQRGSETSGAGQDR